MKRKRRQDMATGKAKAGASHPTPVENMVSEPSVEEFCQTGLLMFVNMFLHIFGWAIVVSVDSDGSSIYPARCKFRGFDEKTEAEAYKRLSHYMRKMADELVKESEMS